MGVGVMVELVKGGHQHPLDLPGAGDRLTDANLFRIASNTFGYLSAVATVTHRTPQPSDDTQLVRYDAMCRAIAAAHAVDEVKDIRERRAPSRCMPAKHRTPKLSGRLVRSGCGLSVSADSSPRK